MKVIKTFSWNEIKSSHRLMLLITLALGLLNFFWGEKVPAGGGFGWDGVRYAEMVRNLDEMIAGGQLSSYHTQRILPSAVVRRLLIFSGMSMNDLNIVRGFELYNLILLLAACWAWKRVSNNFSLSLSGRWIGFSGIFINFQSSKQAFYLPVTTDVTALFIAMLLLLFYIEKKPISLFVVTIVGSFCWPVVSICGALLIIFLRVQLPKEVVMPVASSFAIKSFALSSLAKLGGLVVIALSIVGYLIFSQMMPVSERACGAFNSKLQILANIMPKFITPSFERYERLLSANPCVLEKFVVKGEQFFTALPSLFGLLIVLIFLVGSASFFKTVLFSLRRTNLSLVALAIAAVLISALLVNSIANPSIANPGSLTNLIRLILFPPEGKFLLPVVTLAVFWGPLVLLLLLYWNAVTIQARKLGPGVMAVIAISLILGLANEPRFLTIGWPFLVVVVVLALEESNTKTSFKYVLIALTVLYAQFWMKLNLAPWSGDDHEGLQDFPKQVLFMHYGLWMGWWAYVIQLGTLVFSAIWLHKTVIKVGGTKDQCQAASNFPPVVEGSVEFANDTRILKKSSGD